MARFLAFRISIGRYTYRRVPKFLKAGVADWLKRTGHEDLIIE